MEKLDILMGARSSNQEIIKMKYIVIKTPTTYTVSSIVLMFYFLFSFFQVIFFFFLTKTRNPGVTNYITLYTL